MTELQKHDVLKAIEREISNIGSANKCANKCGVSPALVSQVRKGEWKLVSDAMWLKLAGKLGVSWSGWQIAETANYKQMQKVLTEAKQERLFVPVSYPAGSGKTVGINGWLARNEGYNYLIRCREWTRSEFIINLIREIGLEPPKRQKTIDQLAQVAIDRFTEIKQYAPMLILDQANSLKPSALKFLIHLYNALEDEMSVVIVGTENLEKEIKRGVKLDRDGYDEIDSRFGRKYIHLLGATKSDVAKICQANGLMDKALHKAIYKECGPAVKSVGEEEAKVQIEVVEDMRRLKRAIKREQIKSRDVINHVSIN